MRWGDLDLPNNIWNLAAEGTKARRSHELPLAPLGRVVLERLPRLGSYIFADWGGSDKPPTTFSRAKQEMDKLSGVTSWTLHDLRRTCGTGMARLGVPVFVIGRVLNHAESGVARIYARASYLDEKRKALEAWASRVMAITGETIPVTVRDDEPRGLLRPLGTRSEASSGMVRPIDGEVIELHPGPQRNAI